MAPYSAEDEMASLSPTSSVDVSFKRQAYPKSHQKASAQRPPGNSLNAWRVRGIVANNMAGGGIRGERASGSMSFPRGSIKRGALKTPVKRLISLPLCASRWPSMPTLLEELDVNDFTVDLHNAYSPGGHIPHHNSPIQSSRPGLDDSRITHPFEERLRSSWVPWLQGALKTVLWAMDSAVDRAQHHRAAADVSACENHHFENTDVNPCGCALCQQPRFEDNPPLELDVHTARGE